MCRSCLRAACISKHDFQFCFFFFTLLFLLLVQILLLYCWVSFFFSSLENYPIQSWCVSKNPRRCEFSERNEKKTDRAFVYHLLLLFILLLFRTHVLLFSCSHRVSLILLVYIIAHFIHTYTHPNIMPGNFHYSFNFP